MNRKQRQFVNEYLIDRNGKQAAIRAGYKADNAEVVASKMLAIPEIRAAVDEKLEALEKKTLVSAEYVLTTLKEIVERCMQRSPVMEFDHAAKEMVQATDPDTGADLWEFDAGSANRALELLGKHLKLFTEKMEVDIKGNLAEDIKAARKRRENA